ncbi:MAG: precorrin-3B synthase [Pseudomonadota bacterium]
MTDPAIRGWCPGAHHPMASGDGLVVRVRPPFGELTPDQAHGLATAAETYGNGLIDLTNRANLQLRGVTEATHGVLLEDLHRFGLLDDNPEAEGRRNIVLNPFRGIEPEDVQTQITTALAEGLRAPELSTLPSKFGFVVDAGPIRQLSDVSGDIRIEASGDALIVRADGSETGRCAEDPREAATLALDLARWFIASGGIGADGRGRMARHLISGAALPDEFAGDVFPNAPTSSPTPGLTPDGLLVAAAFGQLTPSDLIRLAETGSTIRITPWRMVVLTGSTSPTNIATSTLITDPTNPLLRVQACTGAPGCPRAHAETRTLARRLAKHLPQDTALHVSGCAKGCAHPGPADLTVVAQPGGFDLVRDGAPWDDPIRRGLDPQQAIDLISG